MRCFVAIELGQEVQQALLDFIRSIAQPRDDLRWSRAEQLHLTLRFLGDLDPDAYERARAIVTEISAARPRFDLDLHGTGCFPPRGAPRVLWCGVDDPTDGCAQWVRTAEPRWTELRLPPETRFTPHITLARSRSPTGSEAARIIASRGGGPPRMGTHVSSVALMESRLESGGARYIRQHVAALAPA